MSHKPHRYNTSPFAAPQEGRPATEASIEFSYTDPEDGSRISYQGQAQTLKRIGPSVSRMFQQFAEAYEAGRQVEMGYPANALPGEITPQLVETSPAESSSIDPERNQLAEPYASNKRRWFLMVAHAARRFRGWRAAGQTEQAAIEMATEWASNWSGDQIRPYQLKNYLSSHNSRVGKRYRRMRARAIWQLRCEQNWTIKQIADRFGITPQHCSVLYQEAVSLRQKGDI